MYNRNYAAEVCLAPGKRRSAWPVIVVLFAILAGYGLSMTSRDGAEPRGNTARDATLGNL